jgi:hypothetical protein
MKYDHAEGELQNWKGQVEARELGIFTSIRSFINAFASRRKHKPGQSTSLWQRALLHKDSAVSCQQSTFITAGNARKNWGICAIPHSLYYSPHLCAWMHFLN